MPVERAPCCGVEDKYVDALLNKSSACLSLDLALLLIISRFEKVPDFPELSKMLSQTEIEIGHAIVHLMEIGFLTQKGI